MDLTLKISNQWNKLVLEIKDVAKRAPAATAYAVYNKIGKATFANSQNIVPLDTGALRSTGVLSPPRKSNGYTTTISYGDRLPSVKTNRGKDDVDYAAKVHQSTGVRFRNGKQALYLLRAVRTAIWAADEIMLARSIQKAIDDKIKVSTLKEKLGSAFPAKGGFGTKKGTFDIKNSSVRRLKYGPARKTK